MNFLILTVSNERFFVNTEQLFTTLVNVEQSVMVVPGSKQDRKLLATFESIAMQANNIVTNRHFDLSKHEKLAKVADEFYQGMKELLALSVADKKEPSDYELKNSSLLFPYILKDITSECFYHYMRELVEVRTTVVDISKARARSLLFKKMNKEGVISSSAILGQEESYDEKSQELLDDIANLYKLINECCEELNNKKLGIIHLSKIEKRSFSTRSEKTVKEVVENFVQKFSKTQTDLPIITTPLLPAVTESGVIPSVIIDERMHDVLYLTS